MALVNKIPSMVKSHVDLASYLVEDAFGSVRDISKNVVSHYTVAASMQVCFIDVQVVLRARKRFHLQVGSSDSHQRRVSYLRAHTSQRGCYFAEQQMFAFGFSWPGSVSTFPASCTARLAFALECSWTSRSSTTLREQGDIFCPITHHKKVTALRHACCRGFLIFEEKVQIQKHT